MNEPEVSKVGILDMQVCVPEDWTDEQIKTFADHMNECGTQNGWQIRKEGSQYLAGHPERVACSKKDGYVHVMLDA